MNVYRLWEIKSRKIVMVRNVKFDEYTLPCKTQQDLDSRYTEWHVTTDLIVVDCH